MTSIADYVQSLQLPEAPIGLEATPPDFTDKKQLATVGAQIAEFSVSVPAAVRGAIADSLLLAQLAADKSSSKAEVMDWYKQYLGILKQIGWNVSSTEFQTQSIPNDIQLGMHKAIIPVITAMLGPGAAAASMIASVLNGLKEMDAASPWITLFNRSSQLVKGAKFQISYVDADEQGEPRIKLLCFGLIAKQKVTQVLFFKLSQQQATVKRANAELWMSVERLTANKQVIASRVQPFISSNIANIPI